MPAANIQLQQPTNQTVTGPRFHSDGSRIVVEYDCEEDQGEVAWSEISFEEALAFEYREAACCRADDVIGAHEVRCLERSAYLSDVIDRWQASVGWEEWQQKQGGAARFKHFTVFFDDAGCVNVVAASCAVA
ncbi:MAG TPA: hypothetical protein VJL29_13225 [Thermoguttaceae bacterium]|nr:hypothetical protein [Thermoguttaceae bacterium]